MLSSYVHRLESLRPRGHDRMLPACTSNLRIHKQSWGHCSIMSSFGIMYLLTFCLTVIHLLCYFMCYVRLLHF